MRKAFENKKITLGLFTVALVFAIVIVSSFWPFILDPSRILTNEFLTDELIITAIVMSVTVSMMFVAQASNAQNEASELAKSKVEFKKSVDRIANHTSFFEWVRRVLQPNDRRAIAEREMEKMLLPVALYDMDEPNIMACSEPFELDGKRYGGIDPKRLKAVVALKKRIANMRFVSPNYYTSVRSLYSGMTLSEIARNENSKKVLTVVMQLASRILLTWVGASIMGSLVRDISQAGGSTAEAWMRFLSRAFAFVSSCFLGYNIGCKSNDLDAFYILKRVEVHTLYLEDKAFEPKGGAI